MVFRTGQWLYGNSLNGTKRGAEPFINLRIAQNMAQPNGS